MLLLTDEKERHTLSLEIGIVGLPNVGKSTLFNALTDSNILAANYPFATIEPNTATVNVPDQRLEELSKIYPTAKIIPATINFVDIAGLVQGASKGEGLGNQFLSHIRGVNTIIHVVRSFSDPNVTRSADSKGPKEDIEVINTELVLADLDTLEKRLIKTQKEAKANPKIKPILDNLLKAKDVLESNQPLWERDDIDKSLLDDLHLLTNKKIIYLFNLDENDLSSDEEKSKLKSIVGQTPCLFVCAKLEDELRSLSPEDADEMLKSYGQEESGLVNLVKTAYKTLGLQSYLTAGDDEVRAWTIKSGSTAPEAAGVIHGDFERGFIAAEVMDYNDLVTLGSLPAVKSAGKLRTEGKSYIMKENDIVEFRFNVSK